MQASPFILKEKREDKQIAAEGLVHLKNDTHITYDTKACCSRALLKMPWVGGQGGAMLSLTSSEETPLQMQRPLPRSFITVSKEAALSFRPFNSLCCDLCQ